jgi:hypothetical protein
MVKNAANGKSVSSSKTSKARTTEARVINNQVAVKATTNKTPTVKAPRRRASEQMSLLQVDVGQSKHAVVPQTARNQGTASPKTRVKNPGSTSTKSELMPLTKVRIMPVVKPVKKAVAAGGNSALKPPASTSAKTKRARVPADLALQYGEKATKRNTRADVIPAKERRARRDAAAREKLRQLMRPDEGIMERLARAGALGGDIETTAKSRPTVRRSRKWEARCGKCGIKGLFATPAALCQKCGTILIRNVIEAATD